LAARLKPCPDTNLNLLARFYAEPFLEPFLTDSVERLHARFGWRIAAAAINVSRSASYQSKLREAAETERMHPLDNVIWNALTTRQTHLAESFGEARRFMPEVTSLGGLRANTTEAYESLVGLLSAGGAVALFLERQFEERPGLNLIASAPLLQMVCENGDPPGSQAGSDTELVELGAADSPAMVELAQLTKPGPFDKRTHELGTFLGIRREGRLAAMAGERLKVPGYTEVSAVCTHPEHTGRGYARVLMTEVMRRIRSRGEVPFLHVRENNTRAIELYERLGFRVRLGSQLAVVRRERS
jgi:ribosomal protein S18 acetylase RimI-like enzyme